MLLESHRAPGILTRSRDASSISEQWVWAYLRLPCVTQRSTYIVCPSDPDGGKHGAGVQPSDAGGFGPSPSDGT